MQKTEIDINLDHDLLSFPGYSIEVENNTLCSRVPCYISNKVEYYRRVDLEDKFLNCVITYCKNVKWKIAVECPCPYEAPVTMLQG